MASQQTGAPQGTDRDGVSPAPAQHMATVPTGQRQHAQGAKSPGFAAFGTSSGAAIVFRDLASI